MKTTTRALFCRPTAWNRALIIAFDLNRLEIEQGTHHSLGTAAARSELTRHLGLEGDSSDTVPCFLGRYRQHGDGIEGDIETGDPSGRRGHQAAGVHDAHEIPILFDPVMVGHRAPNPGRGYPVHLSDVVVLRVVANGLELRTEPEPCPNPALVGRSAAAARCR